MNEFFDVDRARITVEELFQRQAPANETGVLRVSEVKNAGFTFETMQYPPSTRLMVQEEGEYREVTMKMFGVMCGGMLPPFIREIRTKSLTSIRNLRQQIKITSLGTPAFDQDMDCLRELRAELQQYVGGNDVGELEFMPHEGYPCLEAHARYFTDRNLVPYDRNIPFPSLLDPNRILSDLQPSSFIRAPDNCVEYAQQVTDGDGNTSYNAIDPCLIKLGDIVEVAFVCVAVPVKEKKYKMLLTLRAVTLLSNELRKDAEARIRSWKLGPVASPSISVKRRRLYVDMDAPVNDQSKRSRKGRSECSLESYAESGERAYQGKEGDNLAEAVAEAAKGDHTSEKDRNVVRKGDIMDVDIV